MRVPRLRIVVDDIFLLVIPLADIDKTVVQRISTPREHTYRRAAVPRNIRYLVSVIGVRRVGHIDGFLVGILHLCREGNVVGETQRHLHIGIHTVYLHQPEVEHSPAELLPFRVGDNFVLHLIVIHIHRYAKVVKDLLRFQVVVRDTHIMLNRHLRTQVGIAHVGIIQVVECRIAIRLLIERIEFQVYTLKWLIREKNCRREFVLIRCFVTLAGFLVDECTEYTRLNTKVIVYIECGGGSQPMRETTHRHIVRQPIPLQIV